MPVNNIGLTPQLERASTGTTDIYQRTNAGDKLAQLAQGLSQFAPSLMRFAEVENDKQNDEDRLQGRNDARAIMEAGKTYKEAIDKGLMPRWKSPIYRIGAYEVFGKTSAETYGQDFEKALAESDVSKSTDPSDFRKFESDFRASWSKDHIGEQQDPHFLNAFGTHADNLMAAKGAEFANAAGKRLEQYSGESFHALVSAAALNGAKAGKSAEAIAQDLSIELEKFIAMGHNRSQANELLASGLHAAATDGDGNEMLTKVADHIKLGTGVLSGTSYGNTFKREALSYINQREVDRQQGVRTEHAADVNKVIGDAEDLFLHADDPHTVDLKPILDRMRKVDPQRVDDLWKLQDSFTSHGETSDPATLRRLTAGVYLGEIGGETLRHALTTKQISVTDFRTLASESRQIAKEGDEKRARIDPRYSLGLDRIRGSFVSLYGEGAADDKMRAASASDAWTVAFYTWKQQHPEFNDNPNDPKAMLALNDLVETQRQSYVKNIGTKEQRKMLERTASGAPTVDWRKHLTTDRSNIEDLAREVTEIESSRRHQLSERSIDILKRAGVDTSSANAMHVFIARQRLFYKHQTPPTD